MNGDDLNKIVDDWALKWLCDPPAQSREDIVSRVKALARTVTGAVLDEVERRFEPAKDVEVWEEFKCDLLGL